MSVSLTTDIITFIHFAFLFNRKKHHEHTLSLLSLFFWKTNTITRPTAKQILTDAIAVCVHSQCLVK